MKTSVLIEIDSKHTITKADIKRHLEVSLAHLNVDIDINSSGIMQIVDLPEFSNVELSPAMYKKLKEFGKKKGLEPIEVINGAVRRLGL